MKSTCIALFCLLIFQVSQGQLDKGTWLVGGSASFSSTKSTQTSANLDLTSEELNLAVAPNIGYFFADKLAAGLSPSFSHGKGEFNTGVTTGSNRFVIGPFVRYYLLSTSRPFNILATAAYQRGLYSSQGLKGDIDLFSVGMGPVIYFNSSVGLEFTFGYSSRVEDVEGSRKTTQKGFQMGIGFQIHLKN